MAGLTVSSFAKINLGLRVLGRRTDGYHEIRTVLQTIDLADEIDFEQHDRLALDVEGRYGVPAGETNLVLRAARALGERYPGHGARIRLRKLIPPGAGLGGGSSNAAATLMGLDRLWGVQADPGVLYGIARQLGMDVPFFLYGGACLALGRGDDVLPMQDTRSWSVVVAWPGIVLSTREVYSDLPLSLTRPRILSSMKGFVPGPPPPSGSAAGERGGAEDPPGAENDADLRPPDLVNDLEGTTFLKVPILSRLKDGLIASGAAAAAMSGSGSAVYGLFSSSEGAGRAAASLGGGSTAVFVCRTLSRYAYRQNLFKRSWT